MLEKKYTLKALNTFGINAQAAYFGAFGSTDILIELLKEAKKIDLPLLILGGGSNLLFTKEYIDFVVLKNEIKGISISETANENEVLVTAGAGEIWHDLVCFSVNNKLHGIENLSLIPGSVGAAPMQNIGAYGVEIKDTFSYLTALNIETLTVETFNNSDCKFGYRESVFKRNLKGKYIILSVSFLLKKQAALSTHYGSIKDELASMGIENPSIKEVSQAVINIRKSKLPNPTELGNAGSFFKNPEVSTDVKNLIESKFPELISYKISENTYKLAAGWLIEKAGLKGYRAGNCGVHTKQALVLVNYGNATGKEVFALSTHVLNTVNKMFGVTLEIEVNII